MSPLTLDDLKAQAHQLTAAARAHHEILSHKAALNTVAQRHGFRTYEAARAALGAPSPRAQARTRSAPRLNPVPFHAMRAMPPARNRAPGDLSRVYFPFAFELARVLAVEENTPEEREFLRTDRVTLPGEEPFTYRDHRRLLIADLLLSVGRSRTPTWDTARDLVAGPVADLHAYLAGLPQPFAGWHHDWNGLPAPVILARVQAELRSLFAA